MGVRSRLLHAVSTVRVRANSEFRSIPRHCPKFKPRTTRATYTQLAMIYPHKPGGTTATISEYDIIVGLSYIWGLHLNDARTTLGSKKDKRKYQAYTSETDSNCVWAAEVRVSYRMAEIRGGMTNTATETTAN